MNKKPKTVEDFEAMMPEAVAKMMEVMSHYGKKYDPVTKTYISPGLAEDTSVNMSPYKGATKSAESPKSRSAKSKVEQLFKK